MSRTNIDIDDRLVAEAMRRYGLSSKKQAVDLALRRLVDGALTADQAVKLEGSGWDGDLEAIRAFRVVRDDE